MLKETTTMDKNESWIQTYGSPDRSGYLGRKMKSIAPGYENRHPKTKSADPKVVISYLKNMSDEEWNKYVILCEPEAVYDHIKTFLDPGIVYEIQQYRREGSLR